MRRLVVAAAWLWPIVVAACIALVSADSSLSATSPKEIALRFLSPDQEPGIGGRVTVFELPTALQPGTTIEAAAGDMHPFTVPKRAWLFWEDLGHGVLFPHPSVLVLLDAGTRAVLADPTMTSFPLIDGRPAAFVGSAAAYLHPHDAIYDRHPLRGLASARPIRTSAAETGTPSAFPNDGLVTLGARSDPTFQYDFDNLNEYAKKLKIDNEAAAPSVTGLVDAITKLAGQGKKDIAVFIGGHGYAAPGQGRTYTDKQGREIHEPESKTPRIVLNEDGAGHQEITLGDLTATLRKFPALTFKIIINSCHAGRFLDSLTALSNVKVVLTATDAANISVVGFGAAIGKGLTTWAATPGATDLVSGLRAAFASEAVKTWAAELPNQLHPQISPSTTTSTTLATSPTAPTSTGTSTTGSPSSSPGCAVVHPQQSCSFTALASTIVLAGTGKGALLIENQITKQGSSFPAPTTATFTPIPGDNYTVRNYSNADMTVRQQ